MWGGCRAFAASYVAAFLPGLVNEVDGAGEFFGQEGCGEEDCHDDDGECGHEAGAPAGVQFVEGDESLVFFVHVDHVDLFVDGGLGGEFGGDFSHGFAVPDAGRRCA